MLLQVLRRINPQRHITCVQDQVNATSQQAHAPSLGLAPPHIISPPTSLGSYHIPSHCATSYPPLAPRRRLYPWLRAQELLCNNRHERRTPVALALLVNPQHLHLHPTPPPPFNAKHCTTQLFGCSHLRADAWDAGTLMSTARRTSATFVTRIFD